MEQGGRRQVLCIVSFEAALALLVAVSTDFNPFIAETLPRPKFPPDKAV